MRSPTLDSSPLSGRIAPRRAVRTEAPSSSETMSSAVVRSGSLEEGTPVGFRLSRALPGAVTFLAVGLTSLYIPLEGGTLVPDFPFINPDNLVLGMTSNNNGDHDQGCFFFNPFLSRTANPTLQNSDELLRWLEVPIRKLLAGVPEEKALKRGTLANPECLGPLLAAARDGG